MDRSTNIIRFIETCDPDTRNLIHNQFSHFFYYPNICHVCHRHNRDCPLRKCGNCKMISYCSRNHQKEHWSLHKNFCKNIGIIKNIVKNDVNNPVNESQESEFKKSLIEEKIKLIYLMESCMERKLCPYENEIIEYPKICEVCHKENNKVLKPCPTCPHANFCEEHEDNTDHKNFCSLYVSCYILDYYAIILQELPILRMMEFTPHNSQIPRMPNSMQEYMDIFFKPRMELKFNFRSQDVKMYVSQHFTRPLTLIYAMKRLYFKPRSELIIHVIGANKREEKSLIEWEILFHWLPHLIKLQVILVGPELSERKLIRGKVN